MTSLNPSLELLRVLAGEGSFHIYRLLRERRLFLFAKCLLTTLAYLRGKGAKTSARSIVFVKGSNQLRYFRHAQLQLADELGDLQLYTSTPFTKQTDAFLLPRISGRAFANQATLLFLMLLTGKRRYLNLYLLAFASAMRTAVDVGFRNIESFVCFNDQPFDVAAILHALHRHQGRRTIVVQHGLILTQSFYFPTIAKEFWAWGELSRQHYRARAKNAQFIIKGRYRDDAVKMAKDFISPSSDRPLRILIAPSYFHDDVRALVSQVSELTKREDRRFTASIKFHPATKLKFLLIRWCKTHGSWLNEESAPMEELSERFDVLITKDSTSAVDFLLRGKPVVFSKLKADQSFPSHQYGFSSESDPFLPADLIESKNIHRKCFLKSALNV